MRRYLALALLALPFSAQTAHEAKSGITSKLTDKEQAEILKARSKVKDAQLQMKNVEDFYRNLEMQIKQLQAAADKVVMDAKAAHNCPDCEVNEDADLVPAKPAAPAPAPGKP